MNMAGLSALLHKEASAEIEAILSEARKQASEILENAKAEAKATVAARERSAAQQRDARLVRARSAAQLAASALKLNAQHDGIQQVFEGVKAKITELIADPQGYALVFEKLLKEAVGSVEGQELQGIVVGTTDQELAEKVAAELGLKAPVSTDATLTGGVRVRTDRNSVENTLFGRLESLQDDLAAEVSAVLFDKAD